MSFQYVMFNAPSAYTIDRAARLGCNWVIVHSAGDQRPVVGAGGRVIDAFPIYFDDYPKVACVRRHQDSFWLEPLRQEVDALCRRAAGHGMKVAFHMYEPFVPVQFESEYPELAPVWKRPTQSGAIDVHSHLDPDNPATWDLLRSKYAEIARDFPLMSMVIVTTWDGAGSFWCVRQAKMSISQRLAKMVLTAREGVRSARKDVTVVFRLWGRNWPREIYLDGHRLIAEMTGVTNAAELMQPVVRPHNDPDQVLPAVLAELPPDVPIMYKSTRMDIADAQPLSLALGKYPKDRPQILEVSYEQYHHKPWPGCKLRHIRRGLDAARGHQLAGVLALPINMGNNDRQGNPDAGNLGRMNTWFVDRLLHGDARCDAGLVAGWLAEAFGSPQPSEAVEALLEADDLVDEGIQWGGGAANRALFASLHTTKLYWTFDSFADPAFPYRVAKPTRELLDGLMEMKRQAHVRARAGVQKVKAARAAMHAGLYEELSSGLTMLADVILLCRDWHSYLLMQYGIERKLYPADRVHLGRMSRHAEQFIRNLLALKDAPAGKFAAAHLSFPDEFPLT